MHRRVLSVRVLAAVHAGLGLAILERVGKVVLGGNDNVQGFVMKTDLAVLHEASQAFFEIVGPIVEKIGAKYGLLVLVYIDPAFGV